jgi:hypothetical protein
MIMQRRGFFKRTFLGVAALVAPRWLRAQMLPPEAQMRELASVVLPASLGQTRIDKVAADFLVWLRDYKPGAPMPSGYGFPRTQVVGPYPATHYAEQLEQLGLSGLDAAGKRAAIEKALQETKVDRIPPRANGQHIASDLMAFFYGSSDGEDFLYGVAIKRDDCRGLENSGERPAALT